MVDTTESRVLVVACEEFLLTVVTVLLHAPTDCEGPSKPWVGQDGTMSQWTAVRTLELNVVQAESSWVISGVPFRHVDAGMPPVLGPFRTAKAAMEGNHKPVNDGLVFTKKGSSFIPCHEGKLEPYGPSFTAIGSILPPFLLLEDLVKCRTGHNKSDPFSLRASRPWTESKTATKEAAAMRQFRMVPTLSVREESEWPVARWHA
jgi:hypothetical protein